MTEIANALYAIGLILVIGVIVMYVKRNPKLSAELQAEFNKLHESAEHLMDHLHLIHQVASAPTAVAFIPIAQPAAPAPSAAPPAPAPAPVVNDTDPTAPGFVAPPAAAPAPIPAAAPGWTPAPLMSYADCTGQNIPLNPSTTYTITDCPASTMVGTNITDLACDPYILTVNGVGTPKLVQTGQCTVYATGPTIVVSVAPLTPPGVVNLILQVHAGA